MSTVLRQKFIDHMTVRRLSQRTQASYTNAVAGLAAYYRKAPDTLNDDQIQAYLLFLIKERRLAWSSCNVVFSGLRCFYGEVLKWEQTRFRIPPRPRSKRLPMLLSVEDVQRLLEATGNPKHRTLLMTIYGAGLRVSEVVNLKPCHIESNRMMIRTRFIVPINFSFSESQKPGRYQLVPLKRRITMQKNERGLPRDGGFIPCAIALPRT